MNPTKVDRRRKRPIPPAIGEHDGRPVLAATVKTNSDGSRSLFVICPSCGRVNGHGLGPDDSAEGLIHRQAECSCPYPRGYFLSVQTAEAGAAS